MAEDASDEGMPLLGDTWFVSVKVSISKFIAIIFNVLSYVG
jgi:hypothetical protein